MRMILIILGVLIVLGGGGAAAYFYFLNPAMATGGDGEEAVEGALAAAEEALASTDPLTGRRSGRRTTA